MRGLRHQQLQSDQRNLRPLFKTADRLCPSAGGQPRIYLLSAGPHRSTDGEINATATV